MCSPTPCRRGLLRFAALALLAAACGDGGAAPRAPEPAAPARPPQRVLPLNASAADYLARLVPAERAVALPTTAADYGGPRLLEGAWPELPRFDTYTVETVLGLQPDLLLCHAWQAPNLVQVRESGHVPLFELAEVDDLETLCAELRRLGARLGASDAAEREAAELVARHAALAAERRRRGLRAMTYTNFGSGGWSAGRGTTADVAFEWAGLVNAAAEAGLAGNERVDFERLLALDPDVLVVSAASGDESLGATARYLRHEAALSGLSAVREGRVVELAPELFSANSPLLMDAAEELAREVERLFP